MITHENNFGIVLQQNPLELTTKQHRKLLLSYNVICFENFNLSRDELILIMKKFGKLQTWEEQQAPKNYTDNNYETIVNLDNNDFLGVSRMNWHMDQSYLNIKYLPIRSLYCYANPTPGNITSFLDISFVSNLLLKEYPELINASAKFILNTKEYVNKPIFFYCKYTKKHMLRLDSRMKLDDSVNIEKFKKIIKQGIITAPTFHVEWKKTKFVIFDNNKCLHKRTKMLGNCELQRLTSDFWKT